MVVLLLERKIVGAIIATTIVAVIMSVSISVICYINIYA